MANKMTCDCDVIHEEVVKDTERKMQPAEDISLPYNEVSS